MKKNISFIVILLTGSILFTACGREHTNNNESNHIKQEDSENANTNTNNEASEVMSLPVEIYYGNENADAIISKEVEIGINDFDNSTILDELAKVHVVPDKMRILSFESEIVGEDMVLKMDVSKEFAEYVSSMGTAGEYMIIGGFVNTFLKAYNAKSLRLTVEGNALETGHEIYDYDMEFFE